MDWEMFKFSAGAVILNLVIYLGIIFGGCLIVKWLFF